MHIVMCAHNDSHDNVLWFILNAGFLQSLNVPFMELHIWFGVAKLASVVVNVFDGHIQLQVEEERK